jgi:pimeloyl-ACP methyl ester carboxylesterase
MMPLRFVEVACRRVAWRTHGAGPAAVLLHGALSGEALTIDDLAEALAEFVDAIGLWRFALYGTHTGAAIAYAFAARYPERVTALVLDGLAAWTDDERAAYRQDYAPPFLPRWDGAHLTWLWSRMEAQSLFFPWHQQNAATWRKVDLSQPWHLHRNAMDMLDSGDAYRAIYEASLAFDPAAFLPRAMPSRMLMLETDVLRGHAARPALSHLPLGLFETQAGLWRAVATALAVSPGDAAPVWPATGLFWRGSLSGAGRPVVLLHTAGASSRVFEPVLPALAATGPVLAFDLPGHGFDESDLPADAAQIGRVIDTQCRALGVDGYIVAGTRFGGIIAGEMARSGVRAAEIGPRSTATDLAERGAVSLEPQWDGSHLLRAWRIAWRQAIFDPWYQTDAAAALTPPSDPDPASIHAAALDLLRAGPAWVAANKIEAAAGVDQKTILQGQPDLWPAILQGWQ